MYRGTNIPSLRGKYLYSDWCGGWIRWLSWSDGAVSAKGELDLGNTWISTTSFGVDAAGEMHLTSGSSVDRIDPAAPAAP